MGEDQKLLFSNRKTIKNIEDMIEVCSGKKTKTAKAHYYLSNGILVRSGLLSRSYEILTDSLEKLPNNDYECETVNVALNSIYINIRGIIDNLCWILCYENNISINKVTDVYIDGKNFKKVLKEISPESVVIITKYSTWLVDLKEKRDPIAHRIPLYIFPRIIDNEDDRKKAFDLKDEAERRIKEKRSDWTGPAFQSMHIGEFKPVIFNLDIQTGQAKTYPIFPELDKDIENLSNFVSEMVKLNLSSKNN